MIGYALILVACVACWVSGLIVGRYVWHVRGRREEAFDQAMVEKFRAANPIPVPPPPLTRRGHFNDCHYVQALRRGDPTVACTCGAET